MAYKTCLICDKEFYVKPNWLKLGWGKYCSRNCVFESQKKGKWVKCFTCNKDIWRAPKSLLRSKSGKYFCSKSCQTLWRNQAYIGEKSYRNILLRANINRICKRCRLNDSRILAVHHLDRIRQNNKLDNLVWLCHNCHYLIHHDKAEDKIFMEALV